MRRIHYSVASSLDGCIAGPNGEADWIGIVSLEHGVERT